MTFLNHSLERMLALESVFLLVLIQGENELSSQHHTYYRVNPSMLLHNTTSIRSFLSAYFFAALVPVYYIGYLMSSLIDFSEK
jgi:hypothetical protein